MKRLLLVAILALPISPLLQAQSEEGYPSLTSKVLSEYTPTTPETHSPQVMAESAAAFLAALDDYLRNQAALAYGSPEKVRWTNTPPRGEQGGVRLGDLNEEQLQRACDLLAAVLSPQGYAKARNIPLADDRLLRNGQKRPGFGAENYWLAIFGTPSATEPWALQFDGHHLAINLAFQGDAMTMSPTFIGTQPRDFELGSQTVAPMAEKDQAALALIQTLGDDQKAAAVVSSERGDLVAGAGRDGMIPEVVGVSCKGFDEKQRDALLNVIRLYVGDLPAPYADRRMEDLATEVERMTFGWWGPAAENADYSYRIQGPSLIIEYAGQDLGGDPHDHLHSMYRDPTNEYGARLSN